MQRALHKLVEVSFIALVFILFLNCQVLAEKQQQTSREGRQQIVFDSNLSGNFSIYKLAISLANPKLSGKAIQLTNSPLHDMYPAADQGGSRILFARAETLARDSLSDIWSLDLNSQKEHILIRDGTFPSFSNDARYVFFERKRRKLMKYELSTGKETELLPGKFAKWARWKIVKPRVSPNGKFASFTTNRKGYWNAWIVNLETGADQRIGKGCEPIWTENNSLLFIKEKGALSESGIYSFNANTQAISMFHDLADPRGHEYFPVPGNNRVYFSAADESEHSHTEGNYELFLLMGGSRTQLTRNGATNRWASELTQH